LVTVGANRDRVGRRQRIADLYETHATSAMRLCLLLEDDPAAAEDLLHDAFAKVLGRLDALREEQAFGSYLRRTIINLHTSKLRRRRLERAFLRKEAALAIAERAPIDMAEASDVLKVLAGLPPRQRAAIFFRFYEDLSERDVGKALGCSTSAAKATLHRAMTSLRQHPEVKHA
jgi:RNA polymerase sigma factor (sigma-70 family)